MVRVHGTDEGRTVGRYSTCNDRVATIRVGSKETERAEELHVETRSDGTLQR